MKHAIIPTDLSIRSLQAVHDVMLHYGKEPVKITLLHLLDIPSGIGDLLFRLRRMESRYPIPADFQHACEVILNRYGGQLGHLRTSLEYGSTTAVLTNLLEAMKADAVFVQPGLPFIAPFDDSVDFLSMLPHTGVEIVETAPRSKSTTRSAATISDLLLAGG